MEGFEGKALDINTMQQILWFYTKWWVLLMIIQEQQTVM
jgi:hypothetical protein